MLSKQNPLLMYFKHLFCIFLLNILIFFISSASEENAQYCIQSLKFDNLSHEEFLSTWAGCAKFRLNQIFNDCINIKESLKLWPQYLQSNGCRLVSVTEPRDKYWCVQIYVRFRLTTTSRFCKKMSKR